MVQINSARSFVEFNKQDVEGAISDRFERIVGKHPGRIALRTEKSAVTYGELNQRANQIARAILAKRGPKAEPIAVLMEPGIALFATILGVLKSGKFYVPLDPLYPVIRNSYILQDCQTSVLLTDKTSLFLAESLAREGLEWINVDEAASCRLDEDPRMPVSADALAYIIYTSGATGQPKGVVHNHRNILHKVMEYTNTWRVCPDDRLALLYSPSTSGAVRDIFGSLLNGAGLYPFKIKEQGAGPLARWLIDDRITIYNSAASVFRQFVAGLTGQEKFKQLRLIHVGSETIYQREVQSYKQYFSDDCIFVARYGTSEISPIRQFVIEKKTDFVGATVPAGYEVTDAEVLLIGDDGLEVDAGQIGEIAVRSSYVTPGYWQKPELTSAAFVNGPKGENDRIYRTGDMGLLRPDGCLLHLGRKDFQVKVRGHRIEVAEIEIALLNLGVKAAAVVAREDRPGDWRLIAYLVASTQPPPGVRDLRLALMEALPDYMIPSTFEFLDALPMTATGKLDRRALPAPRPARPALNEPFVPPSTSTQATLAKIWAEVLSVNQVGIHDSFFDLGGHSLSASKILARVQHLFDVELPLSTLFEKPTIADLAQAVAAANVQTG
jgi:amino acid adenylation domain-containing protein